MNYRASPDEFAVKVCERERTSVEAIDMLSTVLAYAAIVLQRGIYLRRSTPKIETQIIIDQVAEKHGVSIEEILGPRMYAYLVEARQEAMYRLYEERPNMSMRHIGACLGNRDHTTVRYGIRAHAKRNRLPLVKRG